MSFLFSYQGDFYIYRQSRKPFFYGNDIIFELKAL